MEEERGKREGRERERERKERAVEVEVMKRDNEGRWNMEKRGVQEEAVVVMTTLLSGDG